MRAKWNVGDPPQIEREYLITDTEGNLAICEWSNMWGDMPMRSWFWKTGTYQKVRAWMPLPKPYSEKFNMPELRKSHKFTQYELDLVFKGLEMVKNSSRFDEIDREISAVMIKRLEYEQNDD